MTESIRGRSTAMGEREFMVTAELYISNAAGVALRKPPTQRKKPRESYHSLNEDAKQKARSLNLVGQWRTATCKLTEEGQRCLLNIYVDESILYQTVYIHLLNQSDIRLADSSLFFLKDCLGIYGIDQRWTLMQTAEPIYLQFANADACATWNALLRSYAIPEIYGRWFFPSDGGCYRMWRQVELTIIQGRNFGKTDSSLGNSAPDAVDIDISCEVHLSDILCGRTSSKNGGSPDWHESFAFSDLSPFEYLEITLWREKKFQKPVVLGAVRIILSNFRRGETLEGWFPVLSRDPAAPDLLIGDLRLKIRVDEEIILPFSAYSEFAATLDSRNFLFWMTEFENKLKLKSVANQFISIAVARGVLIEQVQEFASQEFDRSVSSQTLLRGNTILTKVMELCMTWYGKAFLEASIGSVLRKLCHDKIAIEVDPFRSGKSNKDVERNVELLLHWCREFWNQIYSARTECPNEMRKLFETIRKLVEKRHWMDANTELSRELPWQSVSAFCFLRFIVPAILHPHLFGLYTGLPSTPVQRSLTLIAKVIQSLANLNTSNQKEVFMRGVEDFLRQSHPAMVDYILEISTPHEENHISHPLVKLGQRERLNIADSLRDRGSRLPVLDREALPIFPHLLDIPRHLAIIASSVVRHSRGFQARPKPWEAEDQDLHNLCTECFEVEEAALRRVNRLAAQLSVDRDRSKPSSSTLVSTISLTSLNRTAPSPLPSSSGNLRRQNSARPSTAPMPSLLYPRHSDDSLSRLSGPRTIIGSPMTPGKEYRVMPEQTIRGHYKKSPSSESLGIPDTTAAQSSRRTEITTDMSDDGKKKKGILKGILRRQKQSTFDLSIK